MTRRTGEQDVDCVCLHSRRMHEPDGSACRAFGCNCGGFMAPLDDEDESEAWDDVQELDFDH